MNSKFDYTLYATPCSIVARIFSVARPGKTIDECGFDTPQEARKWAVNEISGLEYEAKSK